MAIPKRMISSSRIQGSDEDYSVICIPCHRDEATVPAFCFCTDCQEHLCHTCYKHHKKATILRQHKIQDKDAMPSTQDLADTLVYGGSTDNLTTPCPYHKKEMIKLYCHNHKIFLCSICVAKEHTRPCHVDYIPDISSKIINSRDYNHTIDRVDKLLKKCTKLEKEKSRNANKSNDSLKDVLQAVKTHRQDVNEKLDNLQKEIEAKIKALQTGNNEQLKSVQTRCEDIVKRLKLTYDNMKQMNATKQADQLFMAVKQTQNQLEDYEFDILILSTEDRMDEFKFIPSKAINEALQTEKMIGYISTNTKPGIREGFSSQFKHLPSSAVNITPVFLGEICVDTPTDKQIGSISDITTLPQDRLVVADYDNNSIKLVDVKSNSVVSQLELGTENDDYLCGITSTTNTQVVVTVPKREHIQFISVSSKKLSKSHTIDTNGECWGICCHQGKLVVTYRRPGKLEILDMKGRVITNVTTDSIGIEVFEKADFIQADSSFIYTSDVCLNQVIQLDWNGEITGRIAYITAPKGIALLSDGSLLVSDRNGNRVYQVSDGTSSRIVLKDVRDPHGLFLSDNGHKLFIQTMGTRKYPDNRILVYKI